MENLMPNNKLHPVSLLYVKTELKNQTETDFMAFLMKAQFQWNKCSKNADINVLRNLMAIFFFISRNFTKYYLHAKSIGPFKQKLQKGGGGGGVDLPFSGHTNLQKAQPV